MFGKRSPKLPPARADVNWDGFMAGTAPATHITRAIRDLHLRMLVLEGQFDEERRLRALMDEVNKDR